MDLPKRKPNRLKGYDYSQSGAYFITICVKDRQKLLGKIVGGDAFIAPHTRLSKYGMVVDKYIRRTKGIDKYVIMPNHIHMIIIINSWVSGTIYDNGTMRASSPTQSIPQLVKSLKILITKKIGFSLFQRSYHDHIIRNEKEYKQIWEYIDTNPLKWEEDKYYL
jgi:putative transposase